MILHEKSGKVLEVGLVRGIGIHVCKPVRHKHAHRSIVGLDPIMNLPE